jgi:hypothetical protein
MNAENANKRLIDAMMQAEFYNHPVSQIELVETHISLVFLTGDYAYKIKKPVNFGFLDFTQLERRKYYCEEEIRLNGRLAPDIYLDVVSITESQGRLHLNKPGAIFEYAIRMRQFDKQGLFSRLVDLNKITLNHIDELAERLAGFHAGILTSPGNTEFGNPNTVFNPVKQNFNILRPLLQATQQLDELNFLEQYSVKLYESLASHLQTRKLTGHIRECHGDLHLGNIALSDNKIIIFDGIEFNDSFRWIDTMSDIAFLVMDLQDHHRDDYAAHFLNHYLEISGDYAGLSVLGFYQLYRAMVRAKVAALRCQQETPNSPGYHTSQHQLQNYLQLAHAYTHTATPFIAITLGVSGSGKSWISRQLADRAPAIVIRSDKERKRLFSSSIQDLYTADITSRVYQHLLLLAEQISTHGFNVIVDATFIDQHWRLAFQKLAQKLNLPFHILYCHADTDVLQQRIQKRMTDSNNISDANIQIMQQQLASMQAMNELELTYCIDINTGTEYDIAGIGAALRKP